MPSNPTKRTAPKGHRSIRQASDAGLLVALAKHLMHMHSALGFPDTASSLAVQSALAGVTREGSSSPQENGDEA